MAFALFVPDGAKGVRGGTLPLSLMTHPRIFVSHLLLPEVLATTVAGNGIFIPSVQVASIIWKGRLDTRKQPEVSSMVFPL